LNKTKLISLFLLMAIVSVTGGMALKSTLEFAPAVGWILCLISLLFASVFAVKRQQDIHNKSE
jgi:hypothetical protein